jgi:tetratricopeptide (TPR) repeat protein
MKRLYSLLAACLLTLSAVAQGTLQVEDLSKSNDVYASTNDQAAVRIRCHRDIPLSFSSSMDKSADPFNTNIEGTDSVYYIEFPTGNRYYGRTLTITAPGFFPIDIPLDLSPKQLVTLRIFDPNSMVDAGCYRMHRNKGIEEIKNMNYSEACNQFKVAFECSDVDSVENKANLQLADSLLRLRHDADQAYQMLDYSKAAEIYNIIVGLNSYDSFATDRFNECNTKFSSECTVLFKKAESYFNEKEYVKAKELYQKVLDRGCFQSPMVTDRISSIDRFLTDKKNHANVISYEWMKGAPLGIHIGKYNLHKAGGYFHLNLNTNIFEAIRNEHEIGDVAEVLMGFGWTIKIVDPLWIHFGPGFGTKLYYGEYKEDKYPDEDGKPVSLSDLEEKGDSEKVNAAFSINPEIGLTFKYSYFALRLTYQYRFALKKELEDFLGKHRIMIGVGVAF